MPKRNSRPTDPNQLAHQIVQEATSEPEHPKRPHRSLVSKIMSEMGRKGGKKGGKRRLETMTPEERSQVALRAAQARWSKRKP